MLNACKYVRVFVVNFIVVVVNKAKPKGRQIYPPPPRDRPCHIGEVSEDALALAFNKSCSLGQLQDGL